MVFRPRDLASRMAGRRKPDDGYLRETFTLPRDKARARARDFLNRYPKAAYMSTSAIVATPPHTCPPASHP